MRQFKETKIRFMNATSGCTYPLTYDTWMQIRDDLKPAALFVNFYDEITLAWSKAKSDFLDDEDGLSNIMQYLPKFTREIISDPKKFTKAYMYRCSYNCMGCLRRVKREQERYNNTTSQYIKVGTEELNIFDCIIVDEDIMDKLNTKAFWALIENESIETSAVIDKLVNGTKLPRGIKKQMPDIMKKVCQMAQRHLFNKDIFFGELNAYGIFESAVVVLPDGTKTVYYGETITNPNGDTCAVFFGDHQDYIIPISRANRYTVLDIEF